ncbi:MAG: Ig-like domain-containing protein [Lachnospiraceae bacterium]|nr:Ig-like domain-containing protein [Lachnospiraceae bacterium]
MKKNRIAEKKQSRKGILFKGIMALGMMLLLYPGCRAEAAEPVYVEPVIEGNWIFAGGYPVQIKYGKETNSTAVLCDKTGPNGKPDGVYETTLAESWPDSKYLYIAGGAKDRNVTNADILVDSGKVDGIIGGGYTSAEGKTANVTGESRIMINGGIVGSLDDGGLYFEGGYCCGGGCNDNGGNVNVASSKIRVNGGILNGVNADGKKAVNKEGRNYVGKSSLEFYGGSVFSGAYGDLEESIGQLEQYIVDGANIYCYEEMSSNFDILPAPQNKKGETLASLRIDVMKDGVKQKRVQIDSLEQEDGNLYLLNNVVTTGRGQLSIWLPSDARITGARSRETYYTTNGYAMNMANKHSSKNVITNQVKIPVLKETALIYNGKSQSGFSEVITGASAPYTVVSGTVSQTNAGTITTVFRLREGFKKWEDGTTTDKKLSWTIGKKDQDQPQNLSATGASSSKIADGKISGVTNGMEYSTDQKKWTSLANLPEDATEATGLAAGTYYVRYRGDQNLNVSAAAKVTVKSLAPIISFYDYEGKKKLTSVEGTPVKTSSGKAYNVYVPKEYQDYAFFDKAGGKELSQRLSADKQGPYLTGSANIYLLQPTYVERKQSLELERGKKVVIGYKEAETEQEILNSVLQSGENSMAYFFLWMIREKYAHNEFGDYSTLTKQQLADVMYKNVYYVKPLGTKEMDWLTGAEKDIRSLVSPSSKVFPHLTHSREEGSVMKITLAKPSQGEDEDVKLTFQSIEKEGVETTLVADMGNYPAQGGKVRVLAKDPLRNIVFTTGTLTVTYGQDPKPDVNNDPAHGAGVSQRNGKKQGDETTIDGEFFDFATEDVGVAEEEQEILSFDTDQADLPGATQRYLYLKVSKETQNSLRLKWKKVKGADGYIIYGAKCGAKMERLKTIEKGSATGCTFRKLKKGKYYKYMVMAYRKGETEDKVLTLSPSVHAVTKGSKFGNPTGVTLRKTKLTVRKKKKAKVKAKAQKKKKVKKHIAVIRYESLNPEIVTVTKKGVIRGRKKGKTKILVYTQNGICKRVQVQVK